ncbi:hypothetical protein QSI24_06915 [Klebsiella quasipneumoniae]|uniref:hypothetical protein n=1 Tax=Klebsiella quasipneumoniae TaxID=1463165 RepID=UPI00256E9E05|nr:hypothetical protein [Klebsiella quasipneumoniae]MDL5478934.1 hypothetical protein [Klebsiella quasipneumoniae]
MTKSTITREESVQAVFDLKAGYRLGFADIEILKRVARMALAAMDSEPVAEVVSIYGDPEAFGEREIRPLVGIQQMPYGTKLYRHAQQPVVPDDLAKAFISAIEKEQDRLFGEDYLMDSKDCIDVIREEAQRWNACRAAMLSGGKS